MRIRQTADVPWRDRITQLEIGWLHASWERGLVWVRVGPHFPGAWGLLVKDTRRHPPLFSERNGYARMVRIGWLVVRLLPPDP